MAEVAAGAGIALAAEQVISTTVQVGTAGYLLSKPTQPLKATFTRIATSDDDDLQRRSLARSHHSVTIINNKAHIFGGTTSGTGEIATNDMHIINLSPDKSNSHDPEYQLIPALPTQNASNNAAIPSPRTHHAACAFNSCVAIYGGSDGSGSPIDEGSIIWLWDPTLKTWSQLIPSTTSNSATPGPLISARLFTSSSPSTASKIDAIYLYGGTTKEGRISSDLWRFEVSSLTWIALPNPPVLASPTNAAIADNHLYLISSEDDAMSSSLHILPLPSPSTRDTDPKTRSNDNKNPEALKWTTLTFPTNPLARGPRARHGGALLPLNTGYGRNYLVYLLGARDAPLPPSPPTGTKTDAEIPTQWSDTWTLQLPSSSPLDLSNSATSAFQPAHIKDTLRSTLGAPSGTWSWAEVDLVVPSDPLTPSSSAAAGILKTATQTVSTVGEKFKTAIHHNNPSSTAAAAQDPDEIKNIAAVSDESSSGGGKLHPGPRSFFGADVFDQGRKVFFWGGVDAAGARVGDGWVVGFE